MVSRAGTMEGERTMSKDIPEYTGPYITSTGWTPFKGWTTGTTTNGKRALMYETYFDLSGYELDDLTLLPTIALLQDPGTYISDDSNTPMMEVLDIISQERLDLDTVVDNLINQNMPGFPLSTQDWNQITFGQYRLMLNTAEFNETGSKTWLTAKRDDFGSGSPVVVQKLWIYRIVRFLVNEGKIALIPASRMILSGTVTKEKELVYIQRLRRNYETQGSLT